MMCEIGPDPDQTRLSAGTINAGESARHYRNLDFLEME